MMSNLRITLTITNLRVFFKSSLIAKIMWSFKLILPNLFLVHHVWRTAIIKNKDTASNGCIFMVLRGMSLNFT